MAKLTRVLLLCALLFVCAHASTEINFLFKDMLNGFDNGNCHYTPTSRFNLGGITFLVGAAFEPYIFDNGTGFSPDLFHEFCTRVNCIPSFYQMPQDNSANGLLSWLVNGFNTFTIPINVVADSITITTPRMAYLTFADSYVQAATVLQVLPATLATYPNLASFQNNPAVRVGVLSGTTNVGTALRTFCGGVACPKVISYNSNTELLAALDAGTIQGAVSDFVLRDGLVVPTGAEALSIEDLAAAFPKGDALVHVFNAVLADLKADGTLQSLKNKWSVPGI